MLKFQYPWTVFFKIYLRKRIKKVFARLTTLASDLKKLQIFLLEGRGGWLTRAGHIFDCGLSDGPQTLALVLLLYPT